MTSYDIVEYRGLDTRPLATFNTYQDARQLLSRLEQEFRCQYPSIYLHLAPYRIVEKSC
jgi:hypothetical protein